MSAADTESARQIWLLGYTADRKLEKSDIMAHLPKPILKNGRDADPVIQTSLLYEGKGPKWLTYLKLDNENKMRSSGVIKMIQSTGVKMDELWIELQKKKYEGETLSIGSSDVSTDADTGTLFNEVKTFINDLYAKDSKQLVLMPVAIDKSEKNQTNEKKKTVDTGVSSAYVNIERIMNSSIDDTQKKLLIELEARERIAQLQEAQEEREAKRRRENLTAEEIEADAVKQFQKKKKMEDIKKIEKGAVEKFEAEEKKTKEDEMNKAIDAVDYHFFNWRCTLIPFDKSVAGMP